MRYGLKTPQRELLFYGIQWRDYCKSNTYSYNGFIKMILNQKRDWLDRQQIVYFDDNFNEIKKIEFNDFLNIEKSNMKKIYLSQAEKDFDKNFQC
jgi:hypothetical protein